MDINDMTDEEFKAYELALDRDDWRCDHDKPFTEDCEACDAEWPTKLDAQDVVEGEIVEPEQCDHGVELWTPGFGKCDECDKECNNTEKLTVSLCYRSVGGKRWKFNSVLNEWEPVVKVSSTPGSTWTASKKCQHFMQEFMLDDEHPIYASADRDAPYNEKREKADYPDLAVYLYSGWVSDYGNKFVASHGLEPPWKPAPKYEPQWPMTYLDWPDWGVPKNIDDVYSAIEWTWDHIAQGKTVETGCLGGHGRTGTFLACLMAYRGTKPGTAMTEVWDKYCKEAIESKSQIELIVKVYEHYHGKKWKQSKVERDIVNELLKPAPKTTTPAKTSTNTRAETVCIHGRKLTESCTACDYSGWC